MYVSVDTTRIVRQIGTNLGDLTGCTIESVADAVAAQIQALLPQVVGDGGVILSADHTSVTLQAPSAAWVAANQIAQAASTTRAQHITALAALKPALTANATAITNDITAIQALIASIEAGTQPTAAQVLQVLRFMLRCLVVLNS